jgi:hypothetical protein
LCFGCYNVPDVRERYPISDHKCARRGVANFCGPAAPCVPTAALPGTPAKVQVLEERATSGQSLWHPGDARRIVA